MALLIGDVLGILAIPSGILANLATDKIREFLEKIDGEWLEQLFVEAFCNALKHHESKYKITTKNMRESIQADRSGFLTIFKVNAGNFTSFTGKLTKGDYKDYVDAVAKEITQTFAAETDSKAALEEVVVNDSIRDYQAAFFKTMSEKQASQLTILIQGINHTIIREALSKLETGLSSKKDIERLGERIIAAIEGKFEKKKTKRKRSKPKPKPKPKQNQIKILSIMASPEIDENENLYIDYEREQDTMLDTFSNFDIDHVFPDMPDPVESTLDEIKKYLEDGAHHILHITAHGGTNEKGDGILYLEDLRGKAKPVTGAQLAAVLEPTPKIVILSACRSAHRSPDLVPAAEALFHAAPAVQVVIGMKTAISHLAAVDFNTAFLTALCEGETAEAAFEKGKANIMKGEAKRREEIKDWPYINEHEVPRALWRDRGKSLSVTDFSGEPIHAPGRPGSHDFLGARYLERGFIGRRGILRQIYRAVEDGTGAVVLKGPGGIGKSTLTTRAAAHLRRKGYDFMVVQGETSVERLLEGLSKKAAAAGIRGAEEVYAANAGEKEKLGWFVEHYLKKHPVVIIFDNFESNQDERKQGAFFSEGLRDFLGYFRDVLQFKGSVLFFSTRYRMPGFHARDVVEVGEFSPVEFRKMLQGRGTLKRLDNDSIKNLGREMGGNPRALDLLDRIACREYGTRAFTWEGLKNVMPELRERLLHKKSGEDDFTPLFLHRLVGYLSKPQQRLLRAVSVYRIPVGREAVEAQGVKMDVSHRRNLEGLSLLEYLKDVGDEGLVYVHRLTAGFILGKMRKETLKAHHIRAAEYFGKGEEREGEKYLDLNDAIESRWHFLEAGEWDRAAEITFDLESYLTLHGYPQVSMEFLQDLDAGKLGEENQYRIYGTLGNLYRNFGKYEHAIAHYTKSLEISQKRNDPKGISGNLHNIGMIYQYKGDYDEALKQYQKSLEIREKIGDIKGVSESLHNIGAIYQDKGNYDEALKQFQKAMEVFEKIGNIVNVAICMAQMGTLHFAQNEFETALKLFIRALGTFAKVGSPHANKVAQYIALVREKLPEERFAEILGEYGLEFDAEKSVLRIK